MDSLEASKPERKVSNFQCTLKYSSFQDPRKSSAGSETIENVDLEIKKREKMVDEPMVISISDLHKYMKTLRDE